MPLRAIEGKLYPDFSAGFDDSSPIGSKQTINTLSKAWNVDLTEDDLAKKREGYITESNSWTASGTNAMIRLGFLYQQNQSTTKNLVYGDFPSGGRLAYWMPSGFSEIKTGLAKSVKPCVYSLEIRPFTLMVLISRY